MELWTLRRENKGARSKNSPGIDPCRPSDFSTQVWGSLFKAPLYSPNNNKCIDTGLTSGPPWGDGAEEAGEQQEQGHLSDPVARKSRNPLNTVFPLFFLQVLRENSLWTLRERPNGAAQEPTALALAPDRGLLSTANSAVVLIDVFRGGKNPTSAPLILLLFLVFFFFPLKNSLSYPEGNSY